MATRVSKDSILPFGRACARFSIYPCRTTSGSRPHCPSKLLGWEFDYLPRLHFQPFWLLLRVPFHSSPTSFRPAIRGHAGSLAGGKLSHGPGCKSFPQAVILG